jgi:hypothetical protein
MPPEPNSFLYLLDELTRLKIMAFYFSDKEMGKKIDSSLIAVWMTSVRTWHINIKKRAAALADVDPQYEKNGSMQAAPNKTRIKVPRETIMEDDKRRETEAGIYSRHYLPPRKSPFNRQTLRDDEWRDVSD